MTIPDFHAPDVVPFKQEGNETKSLSKLTVSRASKVNMGNYESEDVFVSLQQDVPEGQDLYQFAEGMLSSVELVLKKKVAQLKGVGGISDPAAQMPQQSATSKWRKK